MADDEGRGRAAYVPILVAVIGLVGAILTSGVWGPPICQAVGVCPSASAVPASGGPNSSGPVDSIVPDAGPAEIFLSLTGGPSGSPVKVSGDGFAAGEVVVIRVSASEVARTIAGPSGTFSSVEITIPARFGAFAPMQVNVVATGQSSLRFATAPFEVSG